MTIYLPLRRVEFLVLDESDKLFELGFVEQIDFCCQGMLKSLGSPFIV